MASSRTCRSSRLPFHAKRVRRWFARIRARFGEADSRAAAPTGHGAVALRGQTSLANFGLRMKSSRVFLSIGLLGASLLSTAMTCGGSEEEDSRLVRMKIGLTFHAQADIDKTKDVLVVVRP